MKVVSLEQALYGTRGGGGYRFLARSPGFRAEWLPEAERLCMGFGERPAGVACPGAVFAYGLGKRHVAVVQASDRGQDDAGRPGALGFYLLVLARRDYAGLGGDPFALAARFPPPWEAGPDLPTLAVPAEPPPRRTVDEVRRVLRRDNGPTLLGGCQALVDGGRLVFERPEPEPELLRDLWLLLPWSTRSELFPATFAFANTLGFDVLVAPRAAGDDYAGYTLEAQAGDYPEGRYELNLQGAAEAGDQEELDSLLARRSSRQTLRLALMLTAASLILVLGMSWLGGPPRPPPRNPTPAGPSALVLPGPDSYPPLNDDQRRRLTSALTELARQVGVDPLPEPATVETLLTAVAARLGPGVAGRDPGAALAEGPPQRRLRALLWKHGLPEYGDPAFNPLELVERLQQQAARRP